jgi:hypothetical protein
MGTRGVGTLAAPGRLAQLGERRLDKAEVTGSSPVSPMQDTPPVNLQDQTERQRARYRAWKSGE